MDLFLDRDAVLSFEKSAAEVTLPEDPNAWPAEILQEIHKQVPYISDFDPQVVMDRVDGERGYGFGHVEVGNKTEIQGVSQGPAAEEAGVRHVRIPIIIRESKLQPLDVIVTDQSKMVPLTEKRLRQSLFRPQMFDITARSPGDQSLISTLYPPYRQTYGFGGGGVYTDAGSGMGKTSSKKCTKCGSMEKCNCGAKMASVLMDILPSINADDYKNFTRQLGDENLKLAFQSNPATAPAIHTLALYDFAKKGSMSRSEKLASSLVPDVVQITHLPGVGYKVKVANHAMWAPAERIVSRGELLKVAGADLVKVADESGAATMVEGPNVVSDPESDHPELIKDFGIYKVKTLEGRELVGFCFPNLLDIDGDPMPMTLFTNGSETALQGEIYGVRVGQGASLIEGRPRGHGLFYQMLPNGKAQATVPIDIQATLAGDGDVTFVSKTPEGREVHVLVQPNINRIVCQDGLHVLVPDSFRWLPLGETKPIAVASTPDEYQKTAQYVGSFGRVQIRASGSESFSLSGGPVEKVAHDERTFVGVDQAMFLLGGLGVDPNYAMRKLGEAVQWNQPIDVNVARYIQDREEVWQGALKKTASSFNAGTLKKSLVKEAAVLPDPESVDTILSLGFINPENVLTFVGYLPKMDEVQSSLCELLIGSRLGMRDLPAPAIERTIRGLEETLEGLRTVAFQST